MKQSLLILALMLGGCQSTVATAPMRTVVVDKAPEERIWLRTDGQRASSSRRLLASFEADKAACIRDEDEVTAESEDCMRHKGYIYVEQSRAPAMAAQLAARRR
jgi:hypothetical protein